MPVLMYGIGTMLWKEGCTDGQPQRIARRMDRVPNARIRKLCGMKKGLDERIDESVLRWFGRVKMMEGDRNARRVYVGEYAGSHLVGRPPKK